MIDVLFCSFQHLLIHASIYSNLLMDSHNLQWVLIYLNFKNCRNKKQWDAPNWTRSPDREASCTGFTYTKHAAGITQRVDTGMLDHLLIWTSCAFIFASFCSPLYLQYSSLEVNSCGVADRYAVFNLFSSKVNLFLPDWLQWTWWFSTFTYKETTTKEKTQVNISLHITAAVSLQKLVSVNIFHCIVWCAVNHWQWLFSSISL